ncbi:MAG: hypothetical protein ACREFC_08690 [Stellaceae bacterium]
MVKDSNRPHVTAETEKEAAARRDRLAAELRANLARRKAQIRARTDDEKPPGEGGSTP